MTLACCHIVLAVPVAKSGFLLKHHFFLLRCTIGTLGLLRQMTLTFIFHQNKEMSFSQALLMDGLLGNSHLFL